MSRVNNNASYIYDVEGETIWEKLKVIRNMLNDRQMAYQLALLHKEKREFKLKDVDASSFEYREYLINKDHNESIIQDVVNEIKFLEEFESYLAKEAEKTRIPGKTDDEMYQINYFHELETRLTRRAQAQMVSYGRIQDDLLLRLMKNKKALSICIKQGLLTEELNDVINNPLLPSTDVHTINFLNNKLEHKDD
jgi:hypothetical protein